MDLSPDLLGPFTREFVPCDERGPHPITEDKVRAECSQMGFIPEMSEEARLKGAELSIRKKNKAYNNRTIVLKNAIAEFHKAIGYKPTQAKNDVWLPCGRIVSHTEFITNLSAIIKEYQPCSVFLK